MGVQGLREYYIGIDPDCIKSGVALWNSKLKKYEFIKALKFFDLLELINEYKDTAMVVLEAGWMNKKNNWHLSQNQFTAQRIAKNVGENHKVGKLIAEYLERIKIEHLLVVPKQKKISYELFLKYTGIKEKNQDKRDAAMLVLGR